MKGRKSVALLAPRSAYLETGRGRGSDVVLWDDCESLRTCGWEFRLHAHTLDSSLEATRLGITVHLPLLSSLQYCGTFVSRNRGMPLLAYNEPTVAFLAPERAVVRFDWPTPLPKYWKQPWALSRFRRAVYMFPSRFLREAWMREHAGIPDSQAVVVPNGVNVRRFRPASDRPAGGQRVGFAGQWVPGKGLWVLLEAWKQVRQAVPDAQLYLAGGASLSRAHSPYHDAVELERSLSKNGHQEGIYAAGVLTHDKMPAFWRDVDIAVVPSMFQEPFGLVALEAMACGLPVVASNDGALPEVVGEAGVIVPRSEPRLLAAALIRLLLSTDERQRLGRLARSRAESFSLHHRSLRLLEVFEHRIV